MILTKLSNFLNAETLIRWIKLILNYKHMSITIKWWVRFEFGNLNVM